MAVRIEREGPVWTVIHSRPETRNAMDPASAEALYDAFRAFEADEGASVAVFWGEGGAFCAGWDLKHAALLADAGALDPFDFPDAGEPPMAAMGPSCLELSKPVIAAVAGPALAGGMELALWADIRVMEETAFMGVRISGPRGRSATTGGGPGPRHRPLPAKLSASRPPLPPRANRTALARCATPRMARQQTRGHDGHRRRRPLRRRQGPRRRFRRHLTRQPDRRG